MYSAPASTDAFLDAVWLEDGLAENTLAAYRRDLSAYARWLHDKAGKDIDQGQSADIQDWFVALYPSSKASAS